MLKKKLLERSKGCKPGQKFIEVVNKELINIMGNENSPLNENENRPTVILMAGLQEQVKQLQQEN